MKCEKCKGDGRMIGGLIDGPQVDGKPTKIPATGWASATPAREAASGRSWSLLLPTLRP